MVNTENHVYGCIHVRQTIYGVYIKLLTWAHFGIYVIPSAVMYSFQNSCAILNGCCLIKPHEKSHGVVKNTQKTWPHIHVSTDTQHDGSKCTDDNHDCCGSSRWGEAQTCKDGYIPKPTSPEECPSSWERCATWEGGIGCYGCYPPRGQERRFESCGWTCVSAPPLARALYFSLSLVFSPFLACICSPFHS